MPSRWRGGRAAGSVFISNASKVKKWKCRFVSSGAPKVSRSFKTKEKAVRWQQKKSRALGLTRNEWRKCGDGVAEMKLKGATTLVDEDDLALLTRRFWQLSGGYVINSGGVKMHRHIIQAPLGKEVDHIDRNPLNNRKSNLRIVDRRTNARNRNMSKFNTTGQNGIHYRGSYNFHHFEGTWKKKTVFFYSETQSARDVALGQIRGVVQGKKTKSGKKPSIHSSNLWVVDICRRSNDGARRAFSFDDELDGDRERALQEACSFRDSVQDICASSNGK